ncbi:MAG TPA: patatin-like phospholipase family protein [Reyranella sp.]|nr:patatin-like phospholipase family protein [Reyranella sp.]
MLGIPNERFFPALGVDPLEAEFIAALERQRLARGLKTLADMPQLQLLAISGGGENGAFGAGLLSGWSTHGTRPAFDLVTGISTGALTAPFAFLGPDYDPQLRAVYTETAPHEILLRRSITAALFNDALADNEPLFRTISRFVDDRMLAGIAAAYDSGRLLLIASTNIDAQVPVIWNIGAIAKSGHPKAADTIRRVLLASAAIPGAFPPSMIDVTMDGKTYQEMHVDGGAIAQTFLYPSALTRNRAQRRQAGQPVVDARAFIIRNGRLDPEWAAVERRTLGIAGRAIATMIAIAGYNDVIRIYGITQRDGIDYNLAFIGSDFRQVLASPFEPGYMRALYDYGYQRALHGYDWAKRPPIF